jgi:hypothetical protein
VGLVWFSGGETVKCRILLKTTYSPRSRHWLSAIERPNVCKCFTIRTPHTRPIEDTAGPIKANKHDVVVGFRSPNGDSMIGRLGKDPKCHWVEAVSCMPVLQN